MNKAKAPVVTPHKISSAETGQLNTQMSSINNAYKVTIVMKNI